MIINIPNWPLATIEIMTLKKILTNWVFSFRFSQRQLVHNLIAHETLFLEP
jgi:hypothetical protein